jgi:hypothetical protein
MRQRVFPELLMAELSLPANSTNLHMSESLTLSKRTKSAFGLRQFFHKHIDHVHVVETDVSLAYKFKYAQLAITKLLENPDLKERIVTIANALMQRYQFESDSIPTTKDVNLLCHKIETLSAEQISIFDEKVAEIERTYRYFGTSALPINEAMTKAEIASLARFQSELEESMNATERYLFQAMYSEPTINRAVALNKDFEKFRTDKGERAVEAFLFKERKLKNASIVSLVISEDKGAREGINQLRKESKNKVLTVNNKGIVAALKYLKNPNAFLMACEEQPQSSPRELSPREKWSNSRDNPRFAKTTERNYQQPAYHRPAQAPTDHEWARRLAEVIQYGTWRKLYRSALKEAPRDYSRSHSVAL